MFCPKCGQQQASDEMRFCSRCGFQLGVVTALIATGGAPPTVIITNDKSDSRLLANRSSRRGAKLIFASGVVAPIAIGFGLLLESPLPLIVPFTIFLAGLALMLYFRLFGEDILSRDDQSLPIKRGELKQDYLPSPQVPLAVETNWQSHSTAEIVQPPSITEHTTRLLEAEENKIKE